MRKTILAMLMAVSTSVMASDYQYLRDYTPDPRDAWQTQSSQTRDANRFYIDENGYTQPYNIPRDYIHWSDVDEDVIDYEVKIILK